MYFQKSSRGFSHSILHMALVRPVLVWVQWIFFQMNHVWLVMVTVYAQKHYMCMWKASQLSILLISPLTAPLLSSWVLSCLSVRKKLRRLFWKRLKIVWVSCSTWACITSRLTVRPAPCRAVRRNAFVWPRRLVHTWWALCMCLTNRRLACTSVITNV